MTFFFGRPPKRLSSCSLSTRALVKHHDSLRVSSSVHVQNVSHGILIPNERVRRSSASSGCKAEEGAEKVSIPIYVPRLDASIARPADKRMQTGTCKDTK